MRFTNFLLAATVLGVGFGQLSCDNRQQGASAQASVSQKMPKLAFADKGVYDFGQMTEGDTAEHVFKFTNTGEFPLIINNITASCGCTTPEWPREPIPPGAQSSIRVRFNSRGKQGEQNKTVTIMANTDPSVTDVQFRAMVNPRPNSTQASASNL